jgi:hypothetical protein
MKLEINVPQYQTEEGIKTTWDNDFIFESVFQGNSIVIKANEAGLRSIARHLLTLAQYEVPAGCHIHYDDLNSLEDGSFEIILEKL